MKKIGETLMTWKFQPLKQEDSFLQITKFHHSLIRSNVVFRATSELPVVPAQQPRAFQTKLRQQARKIAVEL